MTGSDERVQTGDGAGRGQSSQTGEMHCDFCQRVVASVRRVALDRDYERLRTPHTEQYACPDCFERKDRERLGGSNAPR
jgi:hypothetical protein